MNGDAVSVLIVDDQPPFREAAKVVFELLFVNVRKCPARRRAAGQRVRLVGRNEHDDCACMR